MANSWQDNLLQDNFPEVLHPTIEENAILDELNDSYKEISEMSEQERQFLNAIILKNKPKKLLELGVARGGSSIVMLNAIKNIEGAKLYSIDKSDYYYRDDNISTGYAVNNYEYLKDKWVLHTGILATKVIDEIGAGIDFCLLDTAHVNPGEILDFLIVLPYLKNGSILVLHDTNLHTAIKPSERAKMEWCITNNILMSTIRGEKIIPGNFIDKNEKTLTQCKTRFPNIGAIKISGETKKNLWEVFNLLTLKWIYLPSNNDLYDIVSHLERFYNSYYTEYLKKVICFHKNMI